VLLARVCRSLPLALSHRLHGRLALFSEWFSPSPRDDVVGALRYTKAAMLCCAGNSIEREVLFTGVYEPDESIFINSTLRPGMIALDIGANVGVHTLRMAACVGPSGAVWAVEPYAPFVDRLHKNLAINGFSNVTVLQAALSDVEGTAVLYVNAPRNPNRNATLIPDPGNTDVIGHAVPLARLDLVWHATMGRRHIDFVKIDIEGYELPALRAGSAMLRTCRPVVLSEFSGYYASKLGYSWSDILRFFEDCEYRVRWMDRTPATEPSRRPTAYFVATPSERLRPRP
jgi:FkbM family methyltransferase